MCRGRTDLRWSVWSFFPSGASKTACEYQRCCAYTILSSSLPPSSSSRPHSHNACNLITSLRVAYPVYMDMYVCTYVCGGMDGWGRMWREGVSVYGVVVCDDDVDRCIITSLIYILSISDTLLCRSGVEESFTSISIVSA